MLQENIKELELRKLLRNISSTYIENNNSDENEYFGLNDDDMKILGRVARSGDNKNTKKQ